MTTGNSIRLGSLSQLDLEGRNKVEASIKVLQDNAPQDGSPYYLAFSGGKDSCGCYDLCVRAGVPFEAHYHASPVDPTGLVPFIREKYPSVVIEKPIRNFFKEFHKKGYPLRTKRWCCEYIKEWGGSGRVVITGVRGSESRGRATQQMIEEKPRKTRFGKPPLKVVRPIILWNEIDIWEYLDTYKVAVSDLYDIVDRIGCVMCPLASPEQRRYEEKMFPKVATLWEHAFIRLYDAHKEKYGWDKKWSSGHEMYKWWVSY